MGRRLVAAVLGLLILGACSGGTERSTPEVLSTETKPPATAAAATATPVTTEPVAPTTTATPTTSTTMPVTTSTTSTTVTPDTTTTLAATVATTMAVPVPAAEPAACVVEIQPGDSLSLLVATIANEAVNVASLQAENALADPNTINAGDVLDVCVGNDVDDVTGQPRVPPTTAPAFDPAVAVATGTGVAAQQQKLNELFAGSSLPALTVDGDSGRLTRQQLCAARVALGLPISRADMEPGGLEEMALMAAGSLPTPAGAPASAARWALIDKTCQVMFVGEGGGRIVFVFQTSTGEAGYETRNQNASRAFRYDPARASNGWHNSIDYPVPGDNPLNGNMFLPVYFDGGQAIHGANNVPTEPRSKGCARLRVESQRALVDWLGLGDVGRPIWNDPGRIDLTVSVQGRY